MALYLHLSLTLSQCFSRHLRGFLLLLKFHRWSWSNTCWFNRFAKWALREIQMLLLRLCCRNFFVLVTYNSPLHRHRSILHLPFFSTGIMIYIRIASQLILLSMIMIMSFWYSCSFHPYWYRNWTAPHADHSHHLPSSQFHSLDVPSAKNHFTRDSALFIVMTTHQIASGRCCNLYMLTCRIDSFIFNLRGVDSCETRSL